MNEMGLIGSVKVNKKRYQAVNNRIENAKLLVVWGLFFSFLSLIIYFLLFHLLCGVSLELMFGLSAGVLGIFLFMALGSLIFNARIPNWQRSVEVLPEGLEIRHRMSRYNIAVDLIKWENIQGVDYYKDLTPGFPSPYV